MKVLCFPLLLVFASVLLSGCGILGHNIGRLRNAIPNVSNIGNLLRIENHSDVPHPVQIREGKLQRLDLDN